MKKRVKAFIICIIYILSFVCFFRTPCQAVEKKPIKREIAIVFDNSGSMYGSNLSWCRATYSIEMFASMLNDGDILRIYPMNDITVGTESYNMTKPLVINGGGDVSAIRECCTVEENGGTPLETITAAYYDIMNQQADEKWLVILTDGVEFHQNGQRLKEKSEPAATEMLSEYVKNINIMYLGIGSSAIMPEVSGNEKYVYYSKQANDSNEILKSLTDMCNTIFGRNKLEVSGDTINFDVDMSKLIVSVQGKDISDINITGNSKNTSFSPDKLYTPRYSEKGNGGRFFIDYNLSGVVAIYSDMPAGEYSLQYSGTASDIEVYYEPDVDLSLRFVDEDGTNIDDMAEANPGNYYIEYGLTDNKGNYTNSSLIGNQDYEITYTVNGVEKTEKSDKNGKIPVTLNPGDTIDVSAKVTFLDGYVIKKDANDLGWPAGGYKIKENLHDLKLRFEKGPDYFEIPKLKDAPPILLIVEKDGKKLSAEELEQTKIDIQADGLKLTSVPADDKSGYYITIDSSQKIKQGKYRIDASAFMIDETGHELKADATKKIELRPYSKAVRWIIRIAVLALIAVLVVWYMTRKVLPKKIIYTDEMVGLVGKPGNAIIFMGSSRYDRSRRQLRITGTPPALFSKLGTCTITLGLEPVSRRYVKAHKKRVKVVSREVSADFASLNHKLTVDWNGFLYERDAKGKEQSFTPIDDIGSGQEFTLKAFDNKGKKVKLCGRIEYR